MNPVQLRGPGAQIAKRTKHISHRQNLEAQFDLVPLTFFSVNQITLVVKLSQSLSCFLFLQSDEVLTVIKAKAQWPAWQPLNV